ncbi:hypothetical protein HID58_082640 [Brassica napus]|uniref:Uncharacterized protein n=1 Tax=Brassica napus TaxID=3708 RepID=A0ABQ7YB58_BRANA|nr:hypothetical protein HID58_082640 [Brassica napus]
MGINFSSLMTGIQRSTASSPLVVDIIKVQFINVWNCVAEVRQKIKTMETLENKLELLHRQRAVSASGQSYSRTEEINNAFTNEVSWDRSSTSSTQAPTHRPSKRTYVSRMRGKTKL